MLQPRQKFTFFFKSSMLIMLHAFLSRKMFVKSALMCRFKMPTFEIRLTRGNNETKSFVRNTLACMCNVNVICGRQCNGTQKKPVKKLWKIRHTTMSLSDMSLTSLPGIDKFVFRNLSAARASPFLAGFVTSRLIHVQDSFLLLLVCLHETLTKQSKLMCSQGGNWRYWNLLWQRMFWEVNWAGDRFLSTDLGKYTTLIRPLLNPNQTSNEKLKAFFLANDGPTRRND